MSDGDAEETTRSLYNRNVSSSKLLDDKTLEPLPEPKRMAGDIVSFKRRVQAASACPAHILENLATQGLLKCVGRADDANDHKYACGPVTMEASAI